MRNDGSTTEHRIIVILGVGQARIGTILNHLLLNCTPIFDAHIQIGFNIAGKETCT